MGKDHAGPSSRPSSGQKAQLPTLVVHLTTQSTGKAPPEDPSYCGPVKPQFWLCALHPAPHAAPKPEHYLHGSPGPGSPFLCGCHWACRVDRRPPPNTYSTPLGPPASLLGIGPTSCPWSQGKEVVGALERMEQSSLNKGQWPGGSQPKPGTAVFGML